MCWRRKSGILVCVIFLAFACEKKEPKISSPALDPVQLKNRLQKVELRWELLQKDHPPQIETTGFRVNLAEANKAMAEKKYAYAHTKLQELEAWLDQSADRYYLLHLQALSQGLLQEDPKQLWEQAENFWAKEAEAFLNQGKEIAELYGKAGFESAELAVTSALASELSTREKINYCLRLSERKERVHDQEGADKWKAEAKKLLEKRIQLLGDQINWCLSGTVRDCELERVRESQENYLKAKKSLEEGWQELQALIKLGDEIFPHSFFLPDLGGRIQAWISEQEVFFARRDQLASPGGPQDYQALKERERQKQRELVAKYNQAYCQNVEMEELAQFKLTLEKTEVKLEGKTLIFRLRLINNNPGPIFRPRVRLCGGVVSEEIFLGYERYPGNYQASFSVPVLGFSVEDLSSEQKAIPEHWALLSFEDSKGETHRTRAVLKP